MPPVKKPSSGKPNRSKKPDQWHLVTNHQNMLFMLAAGMVMGPAGFRGKHYSDSLACNPGWIPLFRNQVPVEALSQATRERKHLVPCIASFDLSGLSGAVQLVSHGGRVRHSNWPIKRKSKDDIAVLFRAPLPVTLVSRISFRSHEDQQVFESAAKDVVNVDLSNCRIEVDDPLFSLNMETEWPIPEIQGMQDLLAGVDGDQPPAFGLALGGMLAMLYQAANRSELGISIFRLATGTATAKDVEMVNIDPILAELPNWMDGKEIQGEIPVQLFWGCVRELVDAQCKGSSFQAIDVVLEYLGHRMGELREDNAGAHLEKLIGDMRGCLGLGDKTITSLFKQYKGSLSRSLLLFCLRERCGDLLEFSHPLMKDSDYISAGVLFGVRDTWLALPNELRRSELVPYVTQVMVRAEYSRHKVGVSCDVQPNRPMTLLELFSPPSTDNQLNATQTECALELVRQCHWSGCIQTRITLEEGEYPESFTRIGKNLLLPVDTVNVSHEPIIRIFLEKLRESTSIPCDIECEIRRKLKLETSNHENDSQPATEQQ